jgi:glycosyltransferase involved in cell wall biosynthesis
VTGLEIVLSSTEDTKHEMVKSLPVTVLLPVYNAELYLQEAVESILQQSYSDFEILAINDGSTDSSLQILASIKDDRIRIVQNPQNLGLIQTLNKGIVLAKGKYIVRADADDICLPDRIEKQVAFMENNLDIGLSGTGFGMFGENLPLTEKGRFSADSNDIKFKHLYQIHLMHGTSIWRTSVFQDNNLEFDLEFAHAEDYELFERIGELTKLSNIPEILYHVRVHGESVSHKFDNIQEENSIRIKKRGFKRISVIANELELELFRDLCHLDYFKLINREGEIANLLEQMIDGNAKTNYFPIEYLKKRLKKLWVGLCLANIGQSSELKTVVAKHRISTLLPVNGSTKLKIHIKSILKI